MKLKGEPEPSFRLQFHHPFHLQILVALWAVGGEIDGGIVLDESADAVEGLAGCRLVLEDDRELVGLQCSIAIGDVAVEHVVESVVLQNDDAVALSVALCLDEVEAGGDFLAGGEANFVGKVTTVFTMNCKPKRNENRPKRTILIKREQNKSSFCFVERENGR